MMSSPILGHALLLSTIFLCCQAFHAQPSYGRQQTRLSAEKNFWNGVVNLWDEVLEMSTYGPSERRILKARREAKEGARGDNDLSLESFRRVVRHQDSESSEKDFGDPPEFSGYDLRDLLVEKWAAPLDVDFQRAPGAVYCTIMPVAFGSSKCRHESELAYLMHLQGVVEVLHKYNNLDRFVNHVVMTNSQPKPGTDSVPIRLELSDEDLDKIL